jgi:flagellar hook-length control protein FliK
MARNSATSAPPAGGFSSAMNAANRPPETASGNHKADKDMTKSAPTAPSDARTKAGANGNTQSTSTKSAAANSTAGTVNSKQDSSAAAMVAQSDVSLIDADVATQDGKTDRTGGKSRTGGTDTTVTLPSGPAALALMLAASGMQIDGRASSGQPGNSDDGKDDSSAADDSSALPIAANVPVSGKTSTSAQATSSQAVTLAALNSLAALDSDSPSSTLNDVSLLDTGTAQPKAATADAAQSVPSAGPNGLPDAIRSMASESVSSNIGRSITMPVSDENWSGAVAGQIQWMVNSNVQNATLLLSPEHLGPLEVRIDVQSSQVNVTFSASHADTRAALEQSVPRLREIMASGGLTLGQTSVQQEPSSGSQYRPSLSRSAISASQSVDCVSVSAIRGLGLIDEYA